MKLTALTDAQYAKVTVRRNPHADYYIELLEPERNGMRQWHWGCFDSEALAWSFVVAARHKRAP